jgi:nicotinate-nucleotide adenylyltransferase
MSLALLGGTFDPIHKGHLAIAQSALDDERFQIDRVIFIPADIPPHKQKQPITPYADRFAMLELALEDHPRFELSRIEDPTQAKGEPNYSISTVRRVKQEWRLAAGDLYFIIGIDSFRHIDTWREPQALMAECRLVVAHRPGYEKEMAEAVLRVKANPNIHLLEAVSVDVSSTLIRSAVAHDEPLETYVPAAVARYIRAHQLYR